VVSLDAETGALVWRTEVSDLGETCTDTLADEERVYLVQCDGHVVAMRALDRDGRQAWRAGGLEPRLETIGTDRVAILPFGGPLQIVNARDGALRSSEPLSTAHLLNLVGRYLVVSGASEILAVDAATGATLGRFPAANVESIAARGTRLVAVVPNHPHPGALVSYDLAGGTSWTSPRAIASQSPLVIAADVAAVCTDGGVVHGVDLATGTPIWRASIGRYRSPGYDLPCALSAGDTTVLARGAHDRMHAFDPRPSRERVPRVVIRGRVGGARGRIPLWIGDAATMTDSGGSFELPVRATAAVTVRADPRGVPRCMRIEPVSVAIDRRRTYDVTLRIERDECACNECD
jgi:outer membrane protein assembly factor BamB